MMRDLNEVVASQRDILAARGKEGARMPDTLLKHTYGFDVVAELITNLIVLEFTA